jgi:small subunit ribosomal protein S8
MDVIAEFMTRIRNATAARHEKVDVPASNMRAEVARVLREEGFIRNFKVVKDGKQGMMRVYLKYDPAGQGMISGIRRMSRPGRRYYVNVEQIPEVRSGFGISVLSTNKGILSGDEARKHNVGGELLMKVW